MHQMLLQLQMPAPVPLIEHALALKELALPVHVHALMPTMESQ
jgi:hypothetical protein